MFAQLVSRFAATPGTLIYLVAAAILIPVLLAAIVTLAQGQVEKAQLRQAEQLAQRQEAILCHDNHSAAQLSTCLRVSSQQ